MDQAEFDALKATFPWQDVTYSNGVIQIIDRNGNEVELLTIIRFLKVITNKLAPKPN